MPRVAHPEEAGDFTMNVKEARDACGNAAGTDLT